MSKHLLLVPSQNCPAACAYCFGPRRGGAAMDQGVIEAVITWLQTLAPSRGLEITFHGGEPLTAGADFFRRSLPRLRDALASRGLRLALQSNLWLLTDELCELFRQHEVALGTSLDGPEAINDAQRGKGYFRRTMTGIDRARRHGLVVGCICTFTSRSSPRAGEIFDFFAGEGLSFTLHAALPSLRAPGPERWALSPEHHGETLVDLLDRYLDNLNRVEISTLDALCRSVAAGHGGICTFADCLGGYLAVGPRGHVYPCQRFAGLPEYRLASVLDHSSLAAMKESPVWEAFHQRQERIEGECAGCSFLDICRGGCPYNVLAAGSRLDRDPRDPHCPAYRKIFGRISDLALDEVFSEGNLAEVVRRPDPEAGLLRRGRLLPLMRGDPHPRRTARHARVLVAAAALATTASPAEAARRLGALDLGSGGLGSPAGLEPLWEQLNHPARRLNKLYLHVTFGCPLRCDHCYARAGPARRGVLGVESVISACRQAARLGFRRAVVTGGEPLAHPRRDELLDALAAVRTEVKPLLTALRTSLALPLDAEVLRRLAGGTDRVVVSVDGDRETHDRRRGAGSYDITVANLRALIALGGDAELSLATVLPPEQAMGVPGRAVRALARELGIRRTRFRPLLPLGRAADSEIEILPETQWGQMDPGAMVSLGFTPAVTCGIGQNLYIEPDGGAYPCYAWHGESWRLGSIDGDGGLAAVVSSAAFRDLFRHNVNTNRRCRRCALRYLCGGACRAWNRLPAGVGSDLDAPPLDCSPLHRRARSLLLAALAHLEITSEDWRAAGLPLPEAPPEPGRKGDIA